MAARSAGRLIGGGQRRLEVAEVAEVVAASFPAPRGRRTARPVGRPYSSGAASLWARRARPAGEVASRKRMPTSPAMAGVSSANVSASST